MASPVAKDLFHKAIGESGAAFSRNALAFEPQAARARTDSEFASTSLGVQSLKELRALSAQKILDATFKVEGHEGPRFAPDIDGYFLPEQVPAIYAEGKQNDVPLLAGWNRDEGSLTQVHGETPAESLHAVAAKDFGDKADEFLRLYPGNSPANDFAQARRSLKDVAGDRFIAWSTWRWLEAQATAGKQPTYRYRFDLGPPPDPSSPDRGAYHSSEIEYVFGTLDSKAEIVWRPEDRSLSDLMQGYWTNFAISGNPNGPGLPIWPAYRSSTGWEVLYLTAQPKSEKDSARDRYLFLNSVWGK